MWRHIREQERLIFSELMRMTIDWSEEEEISPITGVWGSSRGAVNVAGAEDIVPMSALTGLQESIRHLALRQEELFQAMQQMGHRGGNPSGPGSERCSGPPGGPRGGATMESWSAIHDSSLGTSAELAHVWLVSHAKLMWLHPSPPTMGLPRPTHKPQSVWPPGGSLASTVPWLSQEAREPEDMFGTCFTLDVVIDGVKTRMHWGRPSSFLPWTRQQAISRWL